MTARDDVLSGLEMLFHREGMPNWRDLAAGRTDAYRAEVLREAADRLDTILDDPASKDWDWWDSASIPASCAKILRSMAAAVSGPRGDTEPWRPIRFCGRAATHPAHLYMHAREAVRCMGSAYLGPAQPPADTGQPERVTVVCPHQTPAWTCRSFPECPCGDTPGQPPACCGHPEADHGTITGTSAVLCFGCQSAAWHPYTPQEPADTSQEKP